jgi:hypothetical protein
MENAEARAGFDILNIRQAYLEETARLRFEHYVSDVGVQSAKAGFARVGGLTLEAIQSAVESVEDPAGIITAIVQANDDLMSTKQEQKARDKLYRCVSYRARFWAPNLSLSPGPVSGPGARIWVWGPYLGLGPVSGSGARIWVWGPYLGLKPVSWPEARILAYPRLLTLPFSCVLVQVSGEASKTIPGKGC